MVPQPQELASLDQQLATRGIDTRTNSTPPGDTVTGTLALTQDPNHSGTAPTMTGTATVSGAGAVMGSGAGGGSVVLQGSVPTYSAARTRRVRISPLEVARSAWNVVGGVIESGCAPIVDPATGGITQTAVATGDYSSYPAARMEIPITKPMHGAAFSSVVFYFYVPSLPTSKPSAVGQVALESVAIATGAVTQLGIASINVPGSAASWYAGGAVQSVTIAGLGPPTDTLDITANTYRVVIQDPAISSGEKPSPVWTGIEINYSNVLDESFKQ